MKIPALFLLTFLAISPLLAAFDSAAIAAANPILDVPNSMVQTTSVFPDGHKMMRCSAFVVNAARGWALTAEHCIVEDQIAFFVDGQESEVLRKSKWLALIKFPVMSKPPLSIAKKAPNLSEPTWGFGWAFGTVFLVLERAVAGYDKTDLVTDGAYIERNERWAGVA